MIIFIESTPSFLVKSSILNLNNVHSKLISFVANNEFECLLVFLYKHGLAVNELQEITFDLSFSLYSDLKRITYILLVLEEINATFIDRSIRIMLWDSILRIKGISTQLLCLLVLLLLTKHCTLIFVSSYLSFEFPRHSRYTASNATITLISLD
jgi:hypothetical protein